MSFEYFIAFLVLGILTILALGVFGFFLANQVNRKLNALKNEFATTTQELKRKIEALETTRPAQSPREEHIVAAPIRQPSVAATITPHSTQRQDNVNQPDAFTAMLVKIKNYFMSGNTLVKVGVVLIFFGVSFLLKYAINKNLLPIELRLMGSAMLGVGLVGLGWTLRNKSRDYSLVLQGGGIGVLILTTFVSYKVYGLIPPTFAFSLLVFYTVITSILAVYQNSQNLAAFGFLGGFLAPILVATGEDHHIILFSYYAILNLGILYVSWKETWRELNLMGFIFTFAIGSIWGVLQYQTDYYWSTQPFLILFFLIYIAIPLIFVHKKAPQLRGYVDGTIVFGNSMLTLVLQLELVKGIEYAGAFSALILAAFYIFLSQYLIRHKNPNYKLLSEAFISIGTVFVTIAMPLAFDGLKTSAIWALQAAGIYWVAVKQNKPFARYFSTLLIFATSIAFFLGPQRGTSDTLFLNTYFFSCVMIAAGAYIISFLSEKYQDTLTKTESLVSIATFAMGSVWWVCAGLYEIDRFFVSPILFNVQLAYLAIGTFLLFIIGKTLEWNKLRYFTHGFVFALFVALYVSMMEYTHPFAHYGYVSWAISFLIYYYILFCNDKKFDIQNNVFLKLGHAGALWVLIGVLVFEFNWLGQTYLSESSAWRYAAQGIVPILCILLITEGKNWLSWPVKRHNTLYMQMGLVPIVVATWAWLMVTNWLSSGNAAPLPYIPLLNPLELTHILALFAMTLWIFRLLSDDGIGKSIKKRDVGIVVGATYFIWLNGVLCRAIHHYVGVPFRFSSLFASVEVQVASSLYWTLLGIALMIYATKKKYRWLWVTGASLLAAVVCKMFLIDLSTTETMARVISFMGVGMLFLIVGYFSPIPPKVADREPKNHAQ